MNEIEISELINKFKLKIKEEKERLGLGDSNQENNEAVNNIVKDSSNQTNTPSSPKNELLTNRPRPSSSENASGSMPPTKLPLKSRFLEFGEYEERKQKYIEELKSDYRKYLQTQKENHNPKKHLKNVDRNLFLDHRPVRLEKKAVSCGVQTDISGVDLNFTNVNNGGNHEHRDNNATQHQNSLNVDNSIVDFVDSEENEMSDRGRANQLAVKIDKVEIGTQNIIVPGGKTHDLQHEELKERSRNSGSSPRERLLADLQHSYYPSFYNENNEELIKNRAKWEKARQRDEYQEQLRKQIEEKHRKALEEAERERQHEAALNRRLERQLQQLKTEQDLERSKQIAREERSRILYEDMWQKHRELSSNNQEIASKDYNTPRSYHLNTYGSSVRSDNAVPYSFNIPAKSLFAPSNNRTYNIEDKRKTIEDMPIIRSKSPIEHYTPLDPFARNSPAMQQVEAKWMVPAVKSNSLKQDGKNVLTQLGAIRLQLQQEQLRMNEKLQQQAAKNTRNK